MKGGERSTEAPENSSTVYLVLLDGILVSYTVGRNKEVVIKDCEVWEGDTGEQPAVLGD